MFVKREVEVLFPFWLRFESEEMRFQGFEAQFKYCAQLLQLTK
jgi:hypothetical protein